MNTRMNIRMSYSPMYENNHEHAVICKCGYNLFFDESELTPPETIVTCPNCLSTLKYFTPSLTEKEKFASDTLHRIDLVFKEKNNDV